MTCKYCGKEMPKVTKWDWRCECGANYWNREGYEIWEEPDGYDDDDIYREVPEGCTSCGNPNFPDCKIGCNMFDD